MDLDYNMTFIREISSWISWVLLGGILLWMSFAYGPGYGVSKLEIAILIWICLLIVWLVYLTRKLVKLDQLLDDLEMRRRRDYDTLDRNNRETDEILEDFIVEAREILGKVIKLVPELESLRAKPKRRRGSIPLLKRLENMEVDNEEDEVEDPN